jgi:hypothetical protein
LQILAETEGNDQHTMKSILLKLLPLFIQFLPPLGNICQLYVTQQDKERPVVPEVFGAAEMMYRRRQSLWTTLSTRVAADPVEFQELQQWMKV